MENCIKQEIFNRGDQLIEISASSYLDYQHNVYEEDNGNFDVFISPNSTSGWIVGIPMHNSDRIKKIRLEGNLSPELVHSILKETPNTEIVHITNSNNSICSSGKYTSKNSFKKIDLHNLIDLRLENFTSCDIFYELFCSKLYTGNLRQFYFIGGLVNEKSVNFIHKILVQNMDSLRKIYLPSVIWNHTQFGNTDSILDSVTEIHVDFLPEKYTRGSFISRRICSMFPNLFTFVSSDGYLPLDELKYLLKCTMLINLTVKVVVPKNIHSVDIMKLLADTPKLKYVHLTFWFENKSCVLLGVNEAMKRYKFTESSNCYEDL